MTGPRFTSHERQHRRREVARLYLQGKYQYEIAAILDVSRQLVTYDLKVIHRAWRASTIRDFDAAKAIELAKIDTMEREYWTAWEKSKQQAQRTTTKRTEVTDGNGRTEAHVVKEEQCGDPRYLQGVANCMKQRSDLLGLAAPLKTETKHDFATMTDVERQARIDELIEKRRDGTTGAASDGRAPDATAAN